MPRPKSSNTRKIERLTAQNKAMAARLHEQTMEEFPIVAECESLAQEDKFVISFAQLHTTDQGFQDIAAMLENAFFDIVRSDTPDSEATRQIVSCFFDDCLALRKFYENIRNSNVNNKPQSHDTIRI